VNVDVLIESLRHVSGGLRDQLAHAEGMGRLNVAAEFEFGLRARTLEDLTAVLCQYRAKVAEVDPSPGNYAGLLRSDVPAGWRIVETSETRHDRALVWADGGCKPSQGLCGYSRGSTYCAPMEAGR
jgi:hypothetical protein